MTDLNNKLKGTTSNKLRRCSLIIDYIYNKIIDNDEIRRLMYYNTKNPLSLKGIGYDGVKITQEDVDKSLCDNISKLAFNSGMKIELENYIFINLVSGNFRSNKIIVDVNVLCPTDYIEIDIGMRDFEIGQRITDILDDLYVTNEFAEDIGNLKFTLSDFTSSRLSKSNNYMWLSLRFETLLMPIDRVRL